MERRRNGAEAAGNHEKDFGTLQGMDGGEPENDVGAVGRPGEVINRQSCKGAFGQGRIPYGSQ